MASAIAPAPGPVTTKLHFSVRADAVLTMTWADAEDRAERELRWTFVVEGPGAGAMADVIDGVIAEQFQRLGDRLDAH